MISLILLTLLSGVALYFFIQSRRYRSLLKIRQSELESLAEKNQQRFQASTEEHTRLAAILEGMSEGVVAVDAGQKILLLNSALAKAFQFDRQSSLGRFFWEMFRDPDVNGAIQRALKTRKALRFEHEVWMSGRVYDIQVSPVFSQDEFLGLVAVFRDITMLKEFERLRTEFVANVSHELKTPLTSILGFVETLKDGAVEDAENRMKFLQVIEDQSKYLSGLIENLLYLSRLDSAKEPVKAAEFPLEALKVKMNELFMPLVKEKAIQLSWDIPKDFQIFAEAASFERALLNLIDNAVKYNKPNGTVSVSARVEGVFARLDVADTGSGIASADVPRVFERFYRADKSRSREHGGTGLGLSIAKHILERHHGRIEVQSFPGNGSVFSIFLPLKK